MSAVVCMAGADNCQGHLHTNLVEIRVDAGIGAQSASSLQTFCCCGAVQTQAGSQTTQKVEGIAWVKL